jgi:hypothetical protein
MKIDLMLVLLGSGLLVLLFSFWRAHVAYGNAFNLFDLIMEDGKISRVALWFMIAGAVSTWVIVDMQIKDKLTEGIFGLWLTAWVAPLIAKMVFNKAEVPASTLTVTSTTVAKTEG